MDGLTDQHINGPVSFKTDKTNKTEKLTKLTKVTKLIKLTQNFKDIRGTEFNQENSHEIFTLYLLCACMMLCASLF